MLAGSVGKMAAVLGKTAHLVVAGKAAQMAKAVSMATKEAGAVTEQVVWAAVVAATGLN